MQFSGFTGDDYLSIVYTIKTHHRSPRVPSSQGFCDPSSPQNPLWWGEDSAGTGRGFFPR
jgi:hypothetical protein